MTAIRQATVPKSDPPQRVFPGMGKYTVTEVFYIAGKYLTFSHASQIIIIDKVYPRLLLNMNSSGTVPKWPDSFPLIRKLLYGVTPIFGTLVSQL